MRTSRAGPSRCSRRGSGAARRVVRGFADAVLAAALLGGALWAQPPQHPPPPPPQQPQGAPQGPPRPGAGLGVEIVLDERVQELQGKPIRAIRVLQYDAQKGMQPMTGTAAEAIVRGLQSRVGQPFEARNVTTDVANLWQERRIAAYAFGRLDGGEVELFLIVVQEVQVYERVEFQGLRKFDRREIDVLLGLTPDRQVTSTEAIAMRNVLIARYKREGHAFCSVDYREREPAADEVTGDHPRKILIFRIDEGPKVTVRQVRFRGNVSFPGQPALGLFGTGDYLVREAHIQSGPGWGLVAGGAYSREVLEEDVDRLQLFYRSRGFLDASVNIADVRFTPDHTEVDIDFLVVEGPRYRVKSVAVRRVDEHRAPLPPDQARYPDAEVMAVVQTRPGDFYDHDRIRRDLFAIEDFYGQRGHPSLSFPGMSKVPGAFKVGWPDEHYTEGAEVELTFEIEEGTPKTLRDVLIRGNTFTRDKVIRRKVYALPGERIDMTKVERSLRYLEQTRFFQDALTLAGPRFELLPVPGRDDELDLAIDVKEAETGEFRWGVGISTGAGASATLQFNKRNFDLWNPPSSLNPVTMFDEILGNRAFHGGGQQLDFLVAPGTQISQFQVGWTDPDVFDDYFDTIELRVNGRRRIRRFSDGYTTDTLGMDVGLARNFDERFSAGIAGRIESVEVKDVAADAAAVVFDAEGQTELRGLRATAMYRDYDDLRRPTAGLELSGSYELVGGLLGGEEDMWKATLGSHVYVPVGTNASGHPYVLRFDQFFGIAQAFGQSNDVYLTERFYLGGSNLRGFRFRGAGPSQFGRPVGGEATYTSTLQLSWPLVATRLERDLRDRELLRGVAFLDFGLLGTSITDSTFGQPRLSYGVGLRIEVPVLEIPIALDLAWPLLYEETDDREQFYFSIARAEF